MQNGKRDAHTSIRLPPELKEWLQEYADQLGLPVSWAIRRAVESYREHIEERRAIRKRKQINEKDEPE